MASASALPHLSVADTSLLPSSSRDCISSLRNLPAPFLPPPALTETKARYSRQHSLLVTAQSESSPRRGTRIFNFGGKKEAASAPEPPSSGTQIFRFGIKKKASDDEAENESQSGTQKFKVGSKKAASEAGTMKGGSLAPSIGSALSFGRLRRQDPKTVFVAGATGQIGARIAQKLLRDGFNVRGGVPDLFVAQQLAEFAAQYGVITSEEARRLNVVEFDLKDVESIAKAIGSAGKVVVTIGPSEDGPKSKVSFGDAALVIEAAKLAKAGHLAVVYEPTSAASGDGPLAGLSAFFSSIFGKGAEMLFSDMIDQVVDSDLNYTILKASSTEELDDFSPETQNVVLLPEGSSAAVVGKISKTQVASVVAAVFTNTGISENKVVEVTTRASAAAKPIYELLSAISVDGRRTARAEALAKAEEEKREKAAREKADAEVQAARAEARKAAELAAELEAEAQKLAKEEARAAAIAEKAQAKAEAAAASVGGLEKKVKELGIDGFSMSLPGQSFSFPFKASAPKADDKPKAQESVPKSASSKPPPPAPQIKPPVRKASSTELPVVSAVKSVPASKPQVKEIFGGLFKQETVFVDEE